MMEAHGRLYALARWPTLLLLPLGFGAVTWLTRRFAPEAAGSGIPQVIAAAEQRWTGRWGGQRVTLRTAAWKVVLSALVLLCGGSIGREGPTVQVVAGILRSLTRGLKGGAGRRALIIAGGAAGVAGLPGGIFAPSLATGAGLGAAFARLGVGIAGRDAVVLGMAGYLSGVVQAPLTSAVILMEMTRDPGLVGPLMLAALVGRGVSGVIMPEPIYHLLAKNWRLAPVPAKSMPAVAAATGSPT
jgi:H+/Cl- antiporter ClcA